MLSPTAIAAAAKRIGCSVATVKAISEVESRGAGFSPSGTLKVLFEGHWFYRFTKGKFAQSHPTLCYPKWTKQFYAKTAEGEWARLQEAMKLDRRAALLSASYGAYQIMGFNHAICGWPDVESFFEAMLSSEDQHLNAFDDYIVNSGLADECRLIDADQADPFARLYNGPEYRKNDYAGKILRARARIAAAEAPKGGVQGCQSNSRTVR